MAPVSFCLIYLLSHFVMLLSAQEEMRYTQRCAPFRCGNLKTIGFPFANNTNPECGLLTVDCRDQNPTIQLENGGGPYEVLNISPDNTIIRIFDEQLSEYLKSNRCDHLTNLAFPNSSFISFEIATPKKTFFKCNRTPDISPPTNFKKMSFNDHNTYFSISSDNVPTSLSKCSIIQLPKNLILHHPPSPADDDLFRLLTPEFDLRVRVSEDCYKCYQREGQCKPDYNGKLYCDEAEKGIDLGITQQYLGYTHTFMKMHLNFCLFTLYLFLILVLLLYISVPCHNPTPMKR
jgi:hypothetical protein